MADISTELSKILSAVYGEDVRGSIHDAIDLINKVGEVVLTLGTSVSSTTSSIDGYYKDSLYLNTQTFDLWKCNGTSWIHEGNIEGNKITGITEVASPDDDGLNKITINYSKTPSETFTIKNGSKGSQGIQGDKGDTGNGISMIQLNADYTLTIYYTDGSSTTTLSIRGETGPKGDQGVQGPQGDPGIQGIKGDKGDAGDKGDSIVVSPSKVGKTTTVKFLNSRTGLEINSIQILDGADGQGSGDMSKADYDTNGDGIVDGAEAIVKPAAGEVLTYDQIVNRIPSPENKTDGQFLKYDADSDKWVAADGVSKWSDVSEKPFEEISGDFEVKEVEIEDENLGEDEEPQKVNKLFLSSELTKRLASLDADGKFDADSVKSGTNAKSNVELTRAIDDNVEYLQGNLWNEVWEVGGINNSTGINETDTENIRSVNYISIKPSNKYYIVGSVNIRYYFYDDSKSFISGGIAQNSAITSPSNAKYLRIRTTSSYGVKYKNDVSVFEGETPRSYIPYAKSNVELTSTLENACEDGFISKNYLKGTLNSNFANLKIGSDIRATSGSYPKRLIQDGILTSGTYTISSVNPKVRVYVVRGDNNGIVTSIDEWDTNPLPKTITVSGTARLLFKFSDETDISPTEKIQIEKGTSATSYTEYAKSNVELTEEIGTVRNGGTGVTYIQIGKMVIAHLSLTIVDNVDLSLPTTSGWAIATLRDSSNNGSTSFFNVNLSTSSLRTYGASGYVNGHIYEGYLTYFI